MSEVKIKEEEVKIEILRPFHMPLLSTFCSYEQELVDFLVEDALENQNQRLSLTFLWIYEGRVVSYITLLNDRINLKAAFQRQGIFYRSLPALKIGRLCVDDRFLHRGLGTLMVDFSIEAANSIFENYSGCRFIVLDAKQGKESPVPFYEKQRFKVLNVRKGTTPMCLDLLDNIKLSV